MTDPKDLSQYWKYIELNYPGAYSIVNLINNNFTEMYEEIFHVSSLEDQEEKNLTFAVKKDANGKPQLVTNREGMIFLTVLSESILQLFAKFLTPDGDYKKLESRLKSEIEKNSNPIEESINMCSKCSEINDMKNVYCSKCGNKLL